VRIGDLRLADGRLNRSGICRLFRLAVAAGHYAGEAGEFRELLAAVLFVLDGGATRQAGISNPLGWLCSAIRRGLDTMRSGPGIEHWQSADAKIAAAAGLADDLGIATEEAVVCPG
jgi:hypothetical protein